MALLANRLILGLVLCAACGGGGAWADSGSDDGAVDSAVAVVDAAADTSSDSNVDAPSDVRADSGSDAQGDAMLCPMGCTAPLNATEDCSSGACDFVCDEGWVRRDDACIEALTCTPGLIADPVRVTEDGNRHNTPTVAVSGDVAAVFWVQGSIGGNTRSVHARFYDYPALTPRTDVQVVASAALDKTSRIEVVPVSAGFAVLYDRVDHTFGDSRCELDLFDHDGVRAVGSFTATGGSCGQHALAGSDAGFAMTWWSSQLNARRFDETGMLVAGAATTSIGPHSSGTTSHIVWHADRADYRIAYTRFIADPTSADVLTATLRVRPDS